MKVIQTEYKGYLFRSRLEARWAVFFDACGIDWEYEPEGFELSDGSKYLPDFLLHGVQGRADGDIYVEVKGYMSKFDANKIKLFADIDDKGKPRNPILVVSKIPYGDDIWDITDCTSLMAYKDKYEIAPFNFYYIDGDYFGAHPGVNKNGKFELFGDDSNYLVDRDEQLTKQAYRLARQARFEHGESPNVGGTK